MAEFLKLVVLQDFYNWAADSLVAARDHLEEGLIASCCQGHVLTDWEGGCLPILAAPNCHNIRVSPKLATMQGLFLRLYLAVTSLPDEVSCRSVQPA